MPHKSVRGQAALQRLKVHDGIPAPYDKKKRQVVPNALKALRLKPERKSCVLGDIASQAGWKCKELIERLSVKRTERASAYYSKVKETAKLRAQAKAAALKNNESFKKESAVLASVGMA